MERMNLRSVIAHLTLRELCCRKSVKIEMEILNVGSGNEPMCFDDCVWRGDTNFDGTVNLQDLLPIGLSMGKSDLQETLAKRVTGMVNMDQTGTGHLIRSSLISSISMLMEIL